MIAGDDLAKVVGEQLRTGALGNVRRTEAPRIDRRALVLAEVRNGMREQHALAATGDGFSRWLLGVTRGEVLGLLLVGRVGDAHSLVAAMRDPRAGRVRR